MDESWTDNARPRRPTLRFAAVLAGIGALGCSDIVEPGPDSVATSDLLILPLAPGAPAPPARSVFVSNTRTVTISVLHPDAFNTPFAEVRVPTDCTASAAGLALGPTDSVLVTVQPRPGVVGFDISPFDVAFRDACSVTATAFFGRYGDLSVADGSSTYLDRAAYAAALDLWQEIEPGRWRIVEGSSGTGGTAIAGRLRTGGSFVAAAPR